MAGNTFSVLCSVLETMEEGGRDLLLSLLYVLVIAANAALMMLWGRGGRFALWLMVIGLILCCVIPAGCLELVLLSVCCTVIHFTAGGGENLLPVQGKSVLITGNDPYSSNANKVPVKYC